MQEMMLDNNPFFVHLKGISNILADLQKYTMWSLKRGVTVVENGEKRITERKSQSKSLSGS